MKAWLVTWEWIGDHAKPRNKVAAVLNSRLSGERVREIVEFLYQTEFYTISERMTYVRNKKLNPYPAYFGTLAGAPWLGQVYCGHNPWLFARLVDDLTAEHDEHGEERVAWKERPRPDMSGKHGVNRNG